MAYSGAQTTRLGLGGFPRGLYGSFAGKAEAPDTEPHNPGRITRLGLAAIPRGLYGDFSSKVEAAPEQVEDAPTGGWYLRKPPTEEEEAERIREQRVRMGIIDEPESKPERATLTLPPKRAKRPTFEPLAEPTDDDVAERLLLLLEFEEQRTNRLRRAAAVLLLAA